MRHSIAVHPLHSELNSTGHAPFLAHGRLNKLGILAVKFTCHTPRCEKLFYSKEIWFFFFLLPSFCLQPNFWQVEEIQTQEVLL